MSAKKLIIEARHISSGKVYFFEPLAWAHVENSGEYLYLLEYFKGERPRESNKKKFCCGNK